jgi:hypothetical protein
MIDIQSGDYIGLDLLMPMRNPLKYRFLALHPYIYSLSLELQISYDGLNWVTNEQKCSVYFFIDVFFSF